VVGDSSELLLHELIDFFSGYMLLKIFLPLLTAVKNALFIFVKSHRTVDIFKSSDNG
jgi:hypothetical protein